MATQNRWQDIFLHLKSKGFTVFSPGVKTGDCIERYLVLKLAGASRHGSFSTNDQFYSILCYIPANEYSELESYVDSVRSAMLEMKPGILEADDSQPPSFYDEGINGHMISILYKCYKKKL